MRKLKLKAKREIEAEKQKNINLESFPIRKIAIKITWEWRS
jgi:hypothetical protein